MQASLSQPVFFANNTSLKPDPTQDKGSGGALSVHGNPTGNATGEQSRLAMSCPPGHIEVAASVLPRAAAAAVSAHGPATNTLHTSSQEDTLPSDGKLC
jgi:hypothetical protein